MTVLMEGVLMGCHPYLVFVPYAVVDLKRVHMLPFSLVVYDVRAPCITCSSL